jgi:tail assembly chaperone
MVEFTAGAVRYQTGRINARQQWNIVRRLSPVIAEVLPALNKLSLDKGDVGTDLKVATIQPFMDAIGKLSDTDSDYIIDTCMRAATRGRESGWSRVMTPDGQFMFDDIDMRTMLEITVRTLLENLGDFMSALPGITDAALPPKASS